MVYKASLGQRSKWNGDRLTTKAPAEGLGRKQDKCFARMLCSGQTWSDLHHILMMTEFARREPRVICAIAGVLGCICNVAALFRLQFCVFEAVGMRGKVGAHSVSIHLDAITGEVCQINTKHSTNSLTLISSARARFNTFHSLSRVEVGCYVEAKETSQKATATQLCY